MTGQPKDTFWTADRIARLKELLADGCSASQIAAELGAVSRNAVCSAIRRYGLAKRNEAPKKLASPRPRRKHALAYSRMNPIEAPPAFVPPPLTQDQKDLITGQGKRLLDFDDHPANAKYCRWPINSPPRGSEYFFCGALTLRGCVYCGAHAGRAGAGYGRAG